MSEIYAHIPLTALAKGPSGTVSFPRGVTRVFGIHVSKDGIPTARVLMDSATTFKECSEETVEVGKPTNGKPILGEVSRNGVYKLVVGECLATTTTG